MNKSFKNKFGLILALIFSSITIYTMEIQYDENKNVIEIVHAVGDNENILPDTIPSRNIHIFTPSSPHNNATFIINTPNKVQVGAPFTIDYAVRVNNFTNIPFWSDLIPDYDQRLASDIVLIDNSKPTLGIFLEDEPSLAHKGGKGVWSFPRGLQHEQVSHVTITLKANSAGTISYSTCLATNPPSQFGPIEIMAVDDKPITSPDHAQGYQNDPITICVLDNDISVSPLKVISVTQPVHGCVEINADNTLTYYPNCGYAGRDSMTYQVEDAAGNTANGLVNVCVLESLKPSIIF